MNCAYLWINLWEQWVIGLKYWVDSSAHYNPLSWFMAKRAPCFLNELVGILRFFLKRNFLEKLSWRLPCKHSVLPSKVR